MHLKDCGFVGAACCLFLVACQKSAGTQERSVRAEPSSAGASQKAQCFSVTAEANSPSTRALFEAKHCQGGGVTWAALLNVLVRRRGATRAVEQPTPDWTGDVQVLSWKGSTARFA